ncbi:hypothetical protein [Capsulimonas corticalis]|uniref:hypothetical protein n=1 Tax=Capsulimonas corticalis TaxID=2219043 RepID=UPI000F65321D|nr:hypothetical protein [Capsulimonas corticalis]
MIILHAFAFAAITALSPDYSALHKLNASFLKAGASLHIVFGQKNGFGLPIEGFEYLALTRSGKTKVVRHLNELRGSVEIKSSKEALDYVRLRTSPATWYLWKAEDEAIEIMDEDHARMLVNYGVGPCLQVGDTTRADMDQAGISAATVTTIHQSYRITRWLLLDLTPQGHQKLILRRVEEDVDTDGGYKMRVLKQMPVTNGWFIPRFE